MVLIVSVPPSPGRLEVTIPTESDVDTALTVDAGSTIMGVSVVLVVTPAAVVVSTTTLVIREVSKKYSLM